MSLSLILAGLLLIGFLCQWIAWRTRLPAILFLLLSGILLGPVSGVLNPGAVFGDLLFPFVSLGVAIILFEGSLTLRFKEVSGLAPAILLLVTLGAVITAAGMAAAAHYLAGLDWTIAILFGALTCVTGPTVIMPMLRAVRPTERIAQTLRWEGIVIDPVGALFAVLAFESIVAGSRDEGWHLFALVVGVGVGLGLVAAFAFGMALRRSWIPEYLQAYAALALVLFVFAVSNRLADESGLLTVTVMGIALGNMRRIDIEHILGFKEHLSTLLISILFILLAARLDWPTPSEWLSGVAILLVAMLVVRPLNVFVCTLFSPLSWRERALLAWIAPRGIVAAAVSALFALKLEAQNIEGAGSLVSLTFLIIIGTVVVQSATSRRLARWLGVAAATPRGVLIIGASRFARELATALDRQNFPAVLADDDWANIRIARMAGLQTYYGNPNSEHAEFTLDVVGTGWMLAMSTQRDVNVLASARYRPEFGKSRVFQLRQLLPGEAPRLAYSAPLMASILFGEAVTHSQLETLIDEGWSIKSSKLTETHTWKAYQARFTTTPQLLFAINEKGHLHFQSTRTPLSPKAGWTVTALAPPGELTAKLVVDEGEAAPSIDLPG